MSNIDHPVHYNSGNAKCKKCAEPIECIDIVRHENFAIGNAIKYLWRSKYKGGIEDLKKAIFYIQDEIRNIEDDSKRITSFAISDVVTNYNIEG